MKRILYSSYTKFAAAVLFVVSITIGALTAINGVVDYGGEKGNIYGFESDFSEARYFSNLLAAPENAVFNVYHNFHQEKKEAADEDVLSAVAGETVERGIEEALRDLYCSDKINYYVRWGNTVFTDCGAVSEQELANTQFYHSTKWNGNGSIEEKSSQRTYYSSPLTDELSLYDEASTVVVCTAVREEYADECLAVWNRQAAIVSRTVTAVIICAALALLMCIYLLCVCGKAMNGELLSIWLDNMWAEVQLAVIACFGIGAAVIYVIIVEGYLMGRFPQDLINIITGAVSAIAGTAVIVALLSLARSIKSRGIVKSSIILRAAAGCLKIFAKIIKRIYVGLKAFKNAIAYAISKKATGALALCLAAYTIIIGFCGFMITEGELLALLCAAALLGLAVFVLLYRERDIEEIKRGVGEIRSHNAGYKIPELKCEDLRKLAESINAMGDSIDESVAAKMRAERMKTELITNVSHDLKTPLTSIISYTELLSRVENLPEEARDYIGVISKKSERLRILTRDLFDISKVQSGNEKAVLERLDAELLINQAAAEFENELADAGIKLCITAEKELYFMADSGKLSRAVSNLIGNILKYSLRGTRAFISASEREGKIIMEFKNTSSYPLDFDAEEIMGRFVRGDEARATEGSGLGLAIAKSYAELCNGRLDVMTDGDMFKAVLTFDRTQPGC